MVKSNASWLAVSALIALMLIAADVEVASAAGCDVTKLKICLPAIMVGIKPSPACCKALKLQRSCFCKYRKDPRLKRYVSSPNAKKILATCRLTIPKCPKL